MKERSRSLRPRRPQRRDHRERPREEEPRTLRGEGSRDFLLDEAIPGTMAGLVGGALMMAFYMAGSSVFGHGPWDAAKMISAVFQQRSDFADLGAAHVVLGFAIHFGVACTLGVLFAMMVPRQGVVMFAVVPLAVLFSLVSYALLADVVAYTIDPLFRDNVHRFLWFAGHLIFGASLMLIQPMRSRRWVDRRYVPRFVRREARAA